MKPFEITTTTVAITFVSFSSLSTIIISADNTNVSCGGHFAPTCAECPQGNGAAWCNGDCLWKNNACVKKPIDSSVDDISCGGHFAPTCAECPQGNGAAWCNGDCLWKNNACVKKPLKSCNNNNNNDSNIFADKCADCPTGPESCNSADCTWHPHTRLCRDALSNDVRTASVHLNYDNPPSVSDAAWWFNRVVPTASADASYFASNGHRFGYGGVQRINKNVGMVLFSLWDQGGCDTDVDSNCNEDDMAKTIACGDGVTCSDFGGEGTGRKSYMYISNEGFPKINEDYYFVTQAAYVGNRKMQYTGYFFIDGAWKLLSRIEVSTNANDDWSLKGLYSFVEQWTEVDTLSERSALYGPSFVAQTDGKKFVQIDTASFSHGTLENHERVNAWQADAGKQFAVGIATGGDVKREAVRGQSFRYAKMNPYYPLLNDFSERIPCLNAASSKEEIEQCLNAPANCEDRREKFKLTMKKGKKKNVTCIWVSRKKNGVKRFCKKGGKIKVSSRCPRTCGMCSAE